MIKVFRESDSAKAEAVVNILTTYRSLCPEQGPYVLRVGRVIATLSLSGPALRLRNRVRYAARRVVDRAARIRGEVVAWARRTGRGGTSPADDAKPKTIKGGHMNTASVNFEDIRAEYAIDYDGDNDALMAFAENWIKIEDVQWQDFEFAYCGQYDMDSEDGAIGMWMHEIYVDDLHRVRIDPIIIQHIDWVGIGNYERRSGRYRAVRLNPTSSRWFVFRNL